MQPVQKLKLCQTEVIFTKKQISQWNITFWY